MTQYLLDALEVLGKAGADFGVFASNMPHLVFDRLRERSPLPLISIVEATREAAVRMGLRRLALFGTQFTMQASFYPDSFAAAGLDVVRPSAEEQALIHSKYMTELVPGRFLADTRSQLMDVVNAMTAREKVDAVILGGTELPLLFGNTGDSPVPLLDTAGFHSDAIVKHILDQKAP